MRVSKEHDERRNEILDTAAELFEAKGYNKTTINDILNKIGIAKGTFYYYFKSKEEVLDAIIERLNEGALIRAKLIKERSDLSPIEKILQLILALRMEEPKSGVMDELHNPENALMHQKTLTGIVNGLTPILTDIVDEGIQAGVFSTPYPKETIQIMLTAALTLTDEGIFSLTDEEKQRLLQAIIYSLETLLGAKPGSFEPVLMALLG
ncbi:MAG: TetR/AcrR family transcriptional regulator [Clostridiales bacterium]|nr:TetR/AcrR family transcriptional regulator [Clostridiales bacterium]